MTDEPPPAAPPPQKTKELALDIQYNEIVDYLKIRNMLKEKYQGTLKGIQVRVAELAAALPEEYGAMAKATAAEPSFALCRDIFDAIRQNDGEDLNMFRQYKSERLQTWYKIMTIYRKGGLCLAEMGNFLNQNVTFEIPSMKAELQRQQLLCAELQKKASEQQRKADDLDTSFKEECATLGVQGVDLKTELKQVGQGIHEVYGQLGGKFVGLGESVAYYGEVIKAIHGDKATPVEDRMPLILHLKEHGLGDTAAFLCALGQATDGIAAPSVVEAAAPAPVEISWGDSDEDDDVGITIGGEGDDWVDVDQMTRVIDGDALAAVSQQPTIDLDIDEQPHPVINLELSDDEGGAGPVIDLDYDEAPTMNLDLDDAGPTIDLDYDDEDDVQFEITVEASGEDASTGAEKILSELATAAREASTKGPEPLLNVFRLRNRLTDELAELVTFLGQRKYELENEDEASSQLNARMASNNTLDDVKKFLALVSECIDIFSSPRSQQLYLIQTSPKNVDRIVSSLQQRKSRAGRMLSACEETRNRCAQAEASSHQIPPRLAAVKESILGIKKVLEEELSLAFKGREVNIVGNINAL